MERLLGATFGCLIGGGLLVYGLSGVPPEAAPGHVAVTSGRRTTPAASTPRRAALPENTPSRALSAKTAPHT